MKNDNKSLCVGAVSCVNMYLKKVKLNYGFMTCFGQRNGYNIEIKEETYELSQVLGYT